MFLQFSFQSQSDLIIQSRQQVSVVDWDHFVDSNPEAWFWHRTDAINALLTWPGRNDLSFAVFSPDQKTVLAVIPLSIVQRKVLPGFSLSKLESFGSPALLESLPKKQRKKVLETIEAAVLDLKKHYKVWEVHFTIPPLTPAYIGENFAKVNPLLEQGFSNALSQTWVLDLSVSEEEVFRRYSETTRNEIRRLMANPPNIKKVQSIDDMQIYYRLHCETYARTGVPPHPFSYFQNIFENFVKKGFAQILLMEREGSVIAAQNTGFYKGSAFYWTGASVSDKMGGENKYLCHLQIMESRRQGCTHYDMGEAFPHLKSGKAANLSRFKRSLGGELFPFFQGVQWPDALWKRLPMLYYRQARRS